MSSAPSPESFGRTAGLSALGPCEQTAPIPGPQKEAPPQGYQTPSSNFAYGTGPKESLNKEYNPAAGKYGE